MGSWRISYNAHHSWKFLQSDGHEACAGCCKRCGLRFWKLTGLRQVAWAQHGYKQQASFSSGLPGLLIAQCLAQLHQVPSAFRAQEGLSSSNLSSLTPGGGQDPGMSRSLHKLLRSVCSECLSAPPWPRLETSWCPSEPPRGTPHPRLSPRSRVEASDLLRI